MTKSEIEDKAVLPGIASDRVRNLKTVPQFCNDYPAFTEGSVRWLLFQRDSNGLSKAVVKLGRRVLIDVDKFFEWVDEQQDHLMSDIEG